MWHWGIGAALRFPSVFADELHEPASPEVLLAVSVLSLFEIDEEVLKLLIPYGNDELPAYFELLHERVRGTRGRGGNYDACERALIPPPCRAVSDSNDNVRILQLIEDLPRPFRQVGQALKE